VPFSLARRRISFASYIKKIKEQRFRDLQEKIATLEKNVTENSIENLETKKHELESLRINAAYCFFRSMIFSLTILL
jgi:hypothetical protein